MEDQKKEQPASGDDELTPEALEDVSGGAITLSPVRLGAADPPEPDRQSRVLLDPPEPDFGIRP